MSLYKDSMESNQKIIIGELISFSFLSALWIPISIDSQIRLHDVKYCNQFYVTEGKWVIGVFSAGIAVGDFRIKINK